MSSVNITMRITKAGTRFIVRYRAGGREAKLHHVGTFHTRAEAEACRERVTSDLARCVKPTSEVKGELVVYFARLGGNIKIGVSRDPARRCKHLNAILLATEPGGRTREKQLFHKFAEHRINGEWFSDAPEIHAHLAKLEARSDWVRPFAESDEDPNHTAILIPADAPWFQKEAS